MTHDDYENPGAHTGVSRGGSGSLYRTANPGINFYQGRNWNTDMQHALFCRQYWRTSATLLAVKCKRHLGAHPS